MSDKDFLRWLMTLFAILFAGFSCGYTIGKDDGRRQEHEHHVEFLGEEMLR